MAGEKSTRLLGVPGATAACRVELINSMRLVTKYHHVLAAHLVKHILTANGLTSPANDQYGMNIGMI